MLGTGCRVRTVASDYYTILGVTPAADYVVIRAAYRALIRHYHPDANPDPEAQERARQITEAFRVLRDPARRAEYDAQRTGGLLVVAQDLPPMTERRPAPAMRGPAIASACIALAVAFAVWAWQEPSPPPGMGATAPAPRHTAVAKPEPLIELEPESERLARLHEEAALVPDVPPVEPIDELVQAEPDLELPAPPPVVREPRTPANRTIIPAPQRPRVASAPPLRAPSRRAAKARTESSRVSAACRSGGSARCQNERIRTLDRMARGFLSQSMVHASAPKQQLLLNVRDRSAATRSACRSDSCVSEAYLRQMREISAIMEGRQLPTN